MSIQKIHQKNFVCLHQQIYSNGYLLQMFSSYFQTPKGIVQKYIKQAKKSSSAICFPLDFENWKSIESIWQNLLRDSQQ